MKTYFKPRVYLSARISPDAHDQNNKIARELETYFDVFKPHEFQDCVIPHEQIDYSAYHMDITAMEQSDACVLIPPYGRDCAFEIGWFDGRDIPIFVVANDNTDWLRDAMLKGSFTAVFTGNEFVYQKLLRDPIVRLKTYFISNPSELNDYILEIIDERTKGKVII